MKGTKYKPRTKQKKKAKEEIKSKRSKIRKVKPVESLLDKPLLSAEDAKKAKSENLDPLAYMLKVMNDPNEEASRRDRMAIAAAPFCHARKGEGTGKKEEKDDRAKLAGKGRFAPSQAPLKVVK
jgi:phage terminase small subunit